ncbi:MAG: trypsin-like peptidase domain-containing protein [Burkholderiaceae bacterium]
MLVWRPPAPPRPGRWRAAPGRAARGAADGTSVPAHAGYRLAARLAAPAVVSITASTAPSRGAQQGDAWLRRHFGQRGGRAARPQLGLGSGVIISADGYLLTNSHVVQGASDIEVTLSDGRTARASVIGSDPETDLALLRIRLDRLPVIRLGDAGSLQVGDVVLAIGNPFNVGQTVTSGIVSALDRNKLGINTFENFIQTDAAINPGNSGGALVDAEGNLVGINTAIFSRNGGSLGIGFAIPVGTARQVMEALRRDGLVARGYIGVDTGELTPEVAEALKLPASEGVLIRGVRGDAPAARAGVKPGDVMTRIAGQAVRNPGQLLAVVTALKPDSEAVVALLRGTRQLELTVRVAQRPRPEAEPAAGEDDE